MKNLKLSECGGRADCVVCDGEGWVCEDHTDLPWDSWHQAFCGAGQPCACNPAHPNYWPEEDRKRLEEFEKRPDQFTGKKSKEGK